MIFRSLYSKFAFILFIVFFALAALLGGVMMYSSYLYHQESEQKLSQHLAAHIAKTYRLTEKGKIKKDSVKHLFHNFMEINPAIEIYVLDLKGRIVDYNAPPGKVLLKQIDLEPVERFIRYPEKFPLRGNDPRKLKSSKIFSAAPLKENGSKVGYVYVILEGERYDNVVEHMMDSYVINISLWVIAAGVIFALMVALLVFRLMTRRLRMLADDLEVFREGEFSDPPVFKYRRKGRGDEMDRLGRGFAEMADRIIAQVSRLRQSDQQRRELVANVSHDLRTPLTTMQGYLETLLRKSGELNEQQKEKYLKIAVDHSKRLGKLIAELFELARLDANEIKPSMEPFSLQELVHDVIQKYWLLTSNRDIAVQAHFDHSLPFVSADIGLIERVIQNLLENAIRYTPDGGKIEIVLARKGQSVHVQVRDNGCGIAEKELPMIFERFYRAEKSREQHSGGSGLGLAICKRIVELHGGHIKAVSKVNRGTMFIFNLPVHGGM